jgi:hypothetical protein
MGSIGGRSTDLCRGFHRGRSGSEGSIYASGSIEFNHISVRSLLCTGLNI